MRETALHQIWKYALYDTPLHTTNGEEIEVLNPGTINHTDGPDFFNASVKIGGVLWIGNIEIHIKASDWHAHHHGNDDRYDNIILHIVTIANTEIKRKNGQPIPQVELSLSTKLRRLSETMTQSRADIKCADMWQKEYIPIMRLSLTNRLLARLGRRTNEIYNLILSTGHDLDTVMYIRLCRALAGHQNADAMEELAKNIPLSIIGRKRDKVANLEALLFGAAGMLDAEPQDDYTRKLQLTYEGYKAAFRLKNINPTQWKYSRVMPSSFPTVRIAQLAMLMNKDYQLFGKFIDAEKSTDDILAFFDGDVSDYWQSHTTFGKLQKTPTHKHIGQDTRQNIIINAIVPVLFACAHLTADEAAKERAVAILEALPPESNNIIKEWGRLGITPRNAAESQALIEHRKELCDKRDCLRCPVWHKIRKA